MQSHETAPPVHRNGEHDLIELMPQLRPVRSADDLERISSAAAADGHGVLAPTHYVEKRGEIVGSFSLNGCPTVTMWLHSTKVKPRESLALINVVENVMRAQRVQFGAVLCSKTSPFYPLMEKMGFRPRADVTVFVKEI